VTATASVTDGASNAVTDGCVQFSVAQDGHEGGMSVTVPLDSTGKATTPFFKDDETGLPLEINAVPGAWHVQATYAVVDGGVCNQTLSLFDSVTFDVTKSPSAIVVQPTATTLVADVRGQLPGGALETSFRPDGGAVHFFVDGTDVGSSDAVNGASTINYKVPPGSHTVTASYTGDSHYLPADAISQSRRDPVIEARVVSTFPRSKSGWYHNAVDIWFVCSPQGSELTADCPANVSLKKSGKDQTVSRTITAIDGGTGSVTVAGIDIDRDKPVIKVNGRTCTASDKLSGVKGKCRMKIAPNGSYTAIATDRAGNRAVKHGKLN
jgi:hypothetical protein